jgi:hypothetical protein
MKSNLSIFLLIVSHAVVGQSRLEKELDDLNRQIDQAVCDKNLDFMKKHYGDDFVFTHATGTIDSKDSWIKNIANMAPDRFLSREHDSTKVELHGDVAIIFGKLTVARQGKDKVSRYALLYVRVFALRNRIWQMISHKSTSEAHL